jgi:ATP-binding cassette, subfamily B, bacterial
MIRRFPCYLQAESADCGPTCLKMIAQYHGRHYSLQSLRDKCYLSKSGVSMLSISEAAESIGLKSTGVKIDFEDLIAEKSFPCIVHWNQSHFIVVYKIKTDKNHSKCTIYAADPAHGLIKYSKNEFLKGWDVSDKKGGDRGFALLLDPTPKFFEAKTTPVDRRKFGFLWKYVIPHKKVIAWILFAMLIGSLLQLIAPFLTQAIVDKGIGNKDLSFISLILWAQLILVISRTSVDFFRNWLLLRISTRINISLISDFLIKLMKLPIGFFEARMIGDILQRIGDHTRIQNFLTGSSLNVLFSMINLLVFGIVLGIYNLTILIVFIAGSFIYFLWVWLFMKKRREIDYKRFTQLASNQNDLVQLIIGMQEIKLNNCEKQKRWKWEKIQTKLFRVNMQGLNLSYWQQGGGMFLNEIKNIIITFLSVTAVIRGDLSLGMMMSIQYIIGQLNAPVEQMILFIQAAQDAKISMERLGEVHNKEDEEPDDAVFIEELPIRRSITISELFFQYGGPANDMVLKNINLKIEEGKITAIVGTSGSGKTTLLKILLGFYKPIKGEIRVGINHLHEYKSSYWRSKCGVVMQDGYIFSDTILGNIAPADDDPDLKRVQAAMQVANISELIAELPLGLNTKIGQDGHGLSQGQIQRILIARAVYKQPDFIFFDEATNSLDSQNERIIMDNLDSFFKAGTKKTVVVVAHRLSTVRNADQIIVLEKGEIIEQGTHEELTSIKGTYFNLVKNQLELG